MKPLTYERAEKLRQIVLCKDVSKLEASIISGKTLVVDGEATGGFVFNIGFKQPRGEWAYWNWRRRAYPPTDEEREALQDWPGISDGDPVTYGHLEALGIHTGEVAGS